ADPRIAAADGDRDVDQDVVGHCLRVVGQFRRQEGDKCRQHHADDGPVNTAAGSHRRAHLIEAEYEKDDGKEIRRLDQNTHYLLSPAAPFLSLDLNISSMRSVTT